MRSTEDHRGWIVTTDNRDVEPLDTLIGAVPSSMGPESFLRIVDIAKEEQVHPLIHRVSPPGVDRVEAFTHAPKIINPQRSVTSQWVRATAGTLKEAFSYLFKLTAKVANRFTRRPTSRRMRIPPLNAPTQKPRNSYTPTSAASQSPAGQHEPATAPTPNPSPQTRTPEPQGSQNASETPRWDRSHRWTITDPAGVVLVSGIAIGVEGDSANAVQARSAPLNQIPGLPRDSQIHWEDHPEWDVSGVSAVATARNVGYAAREAFAQEGLTRAGLVRASEETSRLLARTASAPRGESEPYEVANRTLEEIFSQPREAETIEKLLARLREPAPSTSTSATRVEQAKPVEQERSAEQSTALRSALRKGVDIAVYALVEYGKATTYHHVQKALKENEISVSDRTAQRYLAAARRQAQRRNDLPSAPTPKAITYQAPRTEALSSGAPIAL
ncbi:hypothetical protein GZ176_11735 [Dermatophilus congolensis]|uniref:hypothetical protein n=1 Tax=Dermatophilus congolensis TaxID=1863 RepID=UPI001AAEFD5C|nr:hypothetical protein [Dermatophilus congolensis]MBO3146353.1 hypothetical protein [Dermatophilus congolensis]MBO3148604.1 hypothetical protein [Dermatophilus congolensis]MBO3157590.1 hypothetical protein [Dermatophilus congolensis]MBO3159870.1 hypothetical protein [Dermatophilus congolensis]MBO3166609.1 hypothetical protein [Dermatophilus congolensis]